jgi:alkanesulfonate monooxygenase SsuD/methylene tetrahydromethanopterin reductase-like flavin-dependent oxidoreductase (luciferase family)
VIRVGVTLPSFRDTPAPALAVAAAAEAAGLDGVFAYDHLFRRARDGTRRPALELLALMGAVAAETHRIAVGSLVARATLRPPAVLANGFDTVARIAGTDRLIAAIGAGDEQSREENESFGLDYGTVADRVEAVHATVDATRDRGYPVWVGGGNPVVRELAAAHADGWNRWGGGVARFREQAGNLRAAAAREPFTISWGGLVVLGGDEREAAAKAARLAPPSGVIVGGPERVADALRAYAEAGAQWLVIGPVDSSDPDNVRMLGEGVLPLLRG